MNQSHDLLFKFTNAKIRVFTLHRIADALLVLFSSFLFLSSLLSILFMLFPWVLLPILFDILLLGWVSFSIIVIFSYVFRKPNVLQMAKKLDALVEIERPMLSIALEIAKENKQSGLHERVYAQACQQLDSYRKQCKFRTLRKKFLVLGITSVLFYLFVTATTSIVKFLATPIIIYVE